MSDLTKQDLEGLERSYITPELVRQAGLFRVTSAEGAQIVGYKGHDNHEGIIFPYVWPGETAARENRLRRDHPEMEMKDGELRPKNKYKSPPGGTNRLYFMPGTPAELLNDISTPALIVEGEKKTIAMHCLAYHDTEQPRFLPVGLSGCWNWRGTVGKTNDEKGARVSVKGPIPDLDRIKWKGRDILIMFDSNVATKDQVRAARRELAKELRRRKAIVHLVDTPEIEGVNGPDDLLAAEGPEFVLSLISEAQDKEERSGRNRNQATVLIELAESAELFHTPEGDAYASVKANGHSEVWPLKSKGFKDYLMRLFYKQEKSAPNAQAMQDALGVLNGKARFDGPTLEVHTRLAEHEGAIYLDLCDENWRVVKVTDEGWSILNDSPVKFRRTKGMLPLPVPTRGGSVHELREFVNVKDDNDFVLLVGWLTAALRGGARNFPILDITGEQGSAKTTTSRVCRALIDPNKAAVRSAPRDEQDLSIAANNGWVIALDNLSSLQQWKSDALCRLSTGGGFATRELYSDSDETIFDATRPILLNGIEDVATRPDLLDRTVILQLPEITEERRLKEKDFWERFEQACPRILGALLDCVATAQKNLSSVSLDRLPRMADFAQWAAAAEPRMNVEPGTFINAYLKNRSAANEWALEASPVAMTLLALMSKRGGWTWTVTLKQLLAELNAELGENAKKPDEWPKSERGLAGALTRCAPNLRKAGWSIADPGREAGSGRSRRTITRIDSSRKQTSQTSQPSQANENGHDSREGWREVDDQLSFVSSQEKANENGHSEDCERCEDESHTHSKDVAFEEVEYETPEEAAEREAVLDYYAGDKRPTISGCPQGGQPVDESFFEV